MIAPASADELRADGDRIVPGTGQVRPADAISRLPAVLDQIDLIDLGPRIRILAQTARPETVRSLDAIHLGAALHSASELTSFVTYDKRLLEAARAAGLPVDSPALRQHRFAR